MSSQISLLEEAGFGGALLYVDPCDLPKTQNLSEKAFMVSLNGGGDPSTPGYPSIGEYYKEYFPTAYCCFVKLLIENWCTRNMG